MLSVTQLTEMVCYDDDDDDDDDYADDPHDNDDLGCIAGSDLHAW